MTKIKKPTGQQGPEEEVPQANGQQPEYNPIAPEILSEKAKNVFATHSVDELFFTVDGTCFTELYQAQAHSVSLGNDSIITVKREEV
jgi:hypothetical protein